MKSKYYFLFLFFFLAHALSAQRTPVLPQIDLPHNYYFRGLYLPQFTSGPSSVAWSPTGLEIVFSMGGSLWKQAPGTETAQQLTDGNGYDFQPDWSPDGRQIIFVRYTGSSVELMLLDLASQKTVALTNNRAVNLEPRWSPDGLRVVYVSTNKTGHFLVYSAGILGAQLSESKCLTPDRKSAVTRYYYSEFDHAINPVWSRDGQKIFFISNREVAHGTGDLVSIPATGGEPTVLHHEETSWQTRPDISPDGSRMVYSSYLGRSWHQLWLLPTTGGYPVPLTYGDYDNTSPRWSPDGKKIAFISNRDGNTGIWMVNAFDGSQKQLTRQELRYLEPHTSLSIQVQDENGNPVACRISVTDNKGKSYAPDHSWVHADDAKFPGQAFETHYFHSEGTPTLSVPKDKLLHIAVSHGQAYEISKIDIDTHAQVEPVTMKLKKLAMPETFGTWWSGDVHVHMNYGGAYRNTPSNLVNQAKAEGLNFVYNLIVNKEQRIIDQPYFSSSPDQASTDQVQLLHSQEFHTSHWGHLGLLGLQDHLIVPGYSGYPQTALQSLFPDNNFIADRAHEQDALVGYVHPFEQSEIFPEQSPALTSELPVAAALGKVDYYEVIGFAEHKACEAVWYKLLNCGFRISAAAGTDAMANYASLRGPIGLNRVYVKGDGPLDHKLFQKNLKAGKSFVTNGPLLSFTVESAGPGDSIAIPTTGKNLRYSAVLRSAVPVEHIEVVWNGEVVSSYPSKDLASNAVMAGSIPAKGPGWLVLRAWSSSSHADLPDMYAYATTNPIYVTVPGQRLRSKSGGEFFMKWLNRLASTTTENNSFRSMDEKTNILEDIRKAKTYYNDCIKSATIP